MNALPATLAHGMPNMAPEMTSGCTSRTCSSSSCQGSCPTSGVVMAEPLPRWSRSGKPGPMRTIGMIGGMSWESSAEYYRLANELVRDRLGGLHSAPLVLASVDFAEVERMQVEGRWEDAGRVLGEVAKGVEAAGAELMVLCTNTMHKVADAVRAEISIPFLDIVDVAADAVTAAGLSTVGLLATGFTMEQDFYRDRFAGHGLRVIVPEAADRSEVHRVIY